MTALLGQTDTTHINIDPAILYLGTPVVLLGTTNPDGTSNLAPISSVFWLGHQAALGVSTASRSSANLARTGEVTLNMPSVDMVHAVDRLALSTGHADVPAYKVARGYRHVQDKFGLAGLTPTASDLIAPPRVAEAPVAMEAIVRRMATDGGLPIVEVDIVRVHAHPAILVTGQPNRIDPDRWRPLVMSFQHFYGLGDRVHPSRLASIDEEHYRD